MSAEGGAAAAGADDAVYSDEYYGSYSDSDEGGYTSGSGSSGISEEPKLKYHRLGASVSDVLAQDAASCLIVCDRFLALGTHWGRVHLLDFHGNEVKRFSVHTATVNALSVDGNGDFVASCSDDGMVAINSLYSDESHEFSYLRPVKAVALHPQYAQKDSRQFCVGGLAGKLIHNKKGWFRSKDSILHAGEGPIYAIQWRGPFIAWANDTGIKVYDVRSEQMIAWIKRPVDAPRPDMFRCNLVWENDHTLLIGWADWIKIGVIKARAREEVLRGSPPLEVCVESMFQTDFFISGIAPYGENLVLLAYFEEEPGSSDDEEEGNGGDGGGGEPGEASQRRVRDPIPCRPELRVVSRQGDAISSDALSTHGWQRYHANDYALTYDTENNFYVTSPKDIVVAKPCDVDDHLSWLLRHEKYEEALMAAEQNRDTLKHHNLEAIGEQMLSHLLNVGQVDRAARMCPSVLQQDKQRWDDWIFAFADKGHLMNIVPFIPTHQPQLKSTVYEMVLLHFLLNDVEGLLNTISQWPPSLYNLETIITAVRQKLKEESEQDPEAGPDLNLMLVLGKLYTHSEKFDKALHIYLHLGIGDVFELIVQHNLFVSIQDKVLLLMQFDLEKAAEMLINNTDKIPISLVVEQLREERRFLHEYLHRMLIKDPHLGTDFHELQVALYADFAPNMLLPFLKQSSSYPLERAYAECASRNIYPAMVFILGRMGNTKEALELIIEKLGDVRQAIDFAQTQNDEELWEDLIEKSINNAEFLGGLLEHIGGNVDPIRLITRIPKGLDIPKLRDRLVKIITDYNLQMSLREGCKDILINDCVELMERLHAAQKRGCFIDSDMLCATCSGRIFVGKDTQPIVPFFCGHVYHQNCLFSQNQNADGMTSIDLWCGICRAESTSDKAQKSAAGVGTHPRR